MLRHLSIRDVVLIDRLDLEFDTGLSVLTGETGAGKSILLDSLGLALGARGDSALVRPSADRAVVSARFELPSEHEVHTLLEERGVASNDELNLRRLLGSDGRSRAFLNDEPVSVGLLRQVGTALVDIHGQFEQHGLLDTRTHRAALDAFGRHEALLTAVSEAFRFWSAARAELATEEANRAAALEEEAFLRHAVVELETLSPEPDEEARLAELRLSLQQAEKLTDAIDAAQSALSADGGVDHGLQVAARALDRVAGMASGRLDGTIAALDRAAAEVQEAQHGLNSTARDVELDPERLEDIEQRLFALRALARKHGVAVDDLADLHVQLGSRLAALDESGDRLTARAQAVELARRSYIAVAENLSRARTRAAAALDAAVAAELPALKLERARFRTIMTALDETTWASHGRDDVSFQVATNPDTAPGPIQKIASGGELSRFMLALKVVMVDCGGSSTLVFDEVDSGVGGATASAVGQRLARLADARQVLVVTHSPQVAAVGAQHWRVAKRDAAERVITEVAALAQEARREEIARMLSGAEVTEEARAAADRLMAGA